MKTTVLLFIAGVLGYQSYGQGFKGTSWAEAVKSKKANVVLTNAHLTRFSESKNGQGSGICFDIMDDFASYVKDTYGVEITYQYKPVSNPADFQLFLSAVKSSEGGVFGLGDITITAERKKVFEFSPPYFSNIAILVTDKSVADLGSMSSFATTFAGLKAVSQRATTHDATLKDLQKKYGNFEIVYAATSEEKTKKVVSAPGYFAYIDFPSYLDLIMNGVAVKRHAAADKKGESFGFIMPKGSDWSPIIAEFFNANGGYVKSEDYQKVLSENLSPKIVKLIKLIGQG